MDYPERKKCLYTIETVHGSAKFMLEQANAQETIDTVAMYWMIKDGDIHHKRYYESRLKKYYKEKLWKSLMYTTPKWKKYFIMKAIYKEIELYEEEIYNILHKVAESIYKWHDIPKAKDSKKYEFDNVNLIVEQTCIPLDQLNERLTLEQRQRLSDKLMRDYLNSFKEWEALNKRIHSELHKQEYKQVSNMIDDDFNYLSK